MKKIKPTHNESNLIKFAILSLVIFTFVLFVLFCFKMFFDADTLFPYRYIGALISEEPSLLIVQPGPRIFPEWGYAWLVMSLTSQVDLWSHLMLLINCTLLAGGLWYFLQQIRELDGIQSGYLLILALTAIPLLSLLQHNYLHYYIFMYGMHAFLLPYVFICFGFFIRHLFQTQTNWFKWIFLSLVLSLLVASNPLIILMFTGPMVAVLLWLWLTGFAEKSKLLHSIVFLFITSVLGLLLVYIFKQIFPSILLMENNYTVFNHGLLQWFSDNKAFAHLVDIKRSGYILLIMLVAFISALIALIRFRKKPHEPLYLGLLFFVVSFISFFVVTWITDKNHIRYMPHLIFFSPLIIFLILYKIKLIKSFGLIAILMSVALLLTLIFDSEPSINEKKRFKVGLSEIQSELSNIKSQFTLAGDGLSDYWFSHAYISQSFQVLPMTKGLNKNTISPVTWAIDLNEYWLYEKGKKTPRIFNMIINYKFSDKTKWIINEHVMLQTFGGYDEVVKFSKGIYDYQIYIYPKGVQSTSFYADLEQYLTSINQHN